MPRELDVKKVCGFYRIYIERAWRGSFATEQDALEIARLNPYDVREMSYLMYSKKTRGVAVLPW